MTRAVGALAAAALGACAHEPKQELPRAARETTLVSPSSNTQCERLRSEGKFQVQLRAVEAEKAFQTLADATCFSFAVEKGIKETVTIHPSDDEPVPVWTWSEFFNALIAEFEKQGVMVKEDGVRRYRVSAVH